MADLGWGEPVVVHDQLVEDISPSWQAGRHSGSILGRNHSLQFLRQRIVRYQWGQTNRTWDKCFCLQRMCSFSSSSCLQCLRLGSRIAF